MRRALVCGAGGFIGAHLVTRLKREGLWVRGADWKRPEFSATSADEFVVGDLRDPSAVARAFRGGVDDVYQLAANMGGAGYIFTGQHDHDVLADSASINLQVLAAAQAGGAERIFFSSSACVYPKGLQGETTATGLREADTYPADPDSDYGLEKLFSERLYLAYGRNTDLKVRLARFHSIVGPESTWTGGREKVFTALCRKVAEAADAIELWGDGQQTRTFLYIDDCLEAVRRLMELDEPVVEPTNVGSDELVSIDELARLIMRQAGKDLRIVHSAGPLGVRGRQANVDRLIALTGWAPQVRLRQAIAETYPWVAVQVAQARSGCA